MKNTQESSNGGLFSERTQESCSASGTHYDTLRYTTIYYDTLGHTATHYDPLRRTTIYYETQRHTAIHYDTLCDSLKVVADLISSLLVGGGGGPLYTVLDFRHSDWPVLESHFGRTEKMRTHVVLKVKSASRLEHRVQSNHSGEAASKTRGQMRTWLLFSSSTICCLQTG